ncbi:hypothetical protein [Desulfospira joergensenii]|uniref:hypothetical protein n=1 Tax=Desulfospira joergensenii TaxID=53329 RepID=UPI0004877BEC|nr:hypothetical protein [Desulfospira joergensenii]
MVNKTSISLNLILLLSLPSRAFASDFTILTVGLGSLLLSVFIIILGVKASFAARAAGTQKARPYMFVILFLVLLGIGIVINESGHMSGSDLTGMLAVILLPGFISFILPIVVGRKNHYNDRE